MSNRTHYTDQQLDDLFEASKDDRHRLVGSEVRALIADIYAARGRCHDCGRPYGSDHGFPDLFVPNDVWKKISPTCDEGGLLCPSCICKRLVDHGIECEGVFRSGPLAAKDLPEIPAAPTYTATGKTVWVDYPDGKGHPFAECDYEQDAGAIVKAMTAAAQLADTQAELAAANRNIERWAKAAEVELTEEKRHG